MPNHKTKQDAEKEKHFTDEQTVRRIHEHLMNEHDRISEADIKNVKTDYRDTKENGNENEAATGHTGPGDGKEEAGTSCG